MMNYPYGDKYPENLLTELRIDADALPDDFPGTLEYVLRTMLTEQERGVIDFRFRQKMTLEESGKEYGVGRERIRQVEAKAIRKLQHPARRNILIQGVRAYYDARSNEREERGRAYFQDGYRKGYDDGYRKGYNDGHCEAEAEKRVIRPIAGDNVNHAGKSVPIEDLDFSTRTFNALMRSGRRTLRDVLDMTANDYLNCYALGKMSVLEILDKLDSIGCQTDELRNRLYPPKIVKRV